MKICTPNGTVKRIESLDQPIRATVADDDLQQDYLTQKDPNEDQNQEGEDEDDEFSEQNSMGQNSYTESVGIQI